MAWTSVIATTPSGKSTTCQISICPGLSTLNHAPAATEFIPSLAFAAIHCEPKLVCDRKPVKDVPIEMSEERSRR